MHWYFATSFFSFSFFLSLVLVFEISYFGKPNSDKLQFRTAKTMFVLAKKVPSAGITLYPEANITLQTKYGNSNFYILLTKPLERSKVETDGQTDQENLP